MIKKSFTGTLVQSGIAFTLLIATFILFDRLSHASEELQPGMRYKIIRPIYLVGAYKSLNNRKLSRETARAYLEVERYAVKSEVAFQVEVSPGTNVIIVSSAKKVWHFPHMVDQYIVRLDPDLSRGLDVVLDLDRGLEGDLNGLNPELFTRIEQME
jgi:hypothetical protein